MLLVLAAQADGLGWDSGAPLALNPTVVEMFALEFSDDGGGNEVKGTA